MVLKSQRLVGPWIYCLSSLVLLCGSLEFSLALSNLDVSEPIIRTSPANDRDNFGFAVVMHQAAVPVDGDFRSFIDNTKLIIGAPQGTYPGGLSGLPTLDPEALAGLVYDCPVSAGNCTGLISAETNMSHNDRRMFDGDPNSLFPIPENKSEQLMGSFLTSNGNYFMSCAPRWVTDPNISPADLDSRRPVGRCFAAPRNLQRFQLIQPCTGMREPAPGPALNADNHCLAGFSGVFLDRSSGVENLALGVVGDNLFNGNIFYYNVTAASAERVGNTSGARSTQITNVYDGYSATVGYITNLEFQDVISGVPRSDGTFLRGQVRVRSPVNYFVDFTISVNGTQTGEYFGFSVAASDLNGDGYDELIVGAPMYSDQESNLQENGRVYVYRNTGGDLDPTPIILTGRSLPLARFGTAIANLGDVNGDSYEDIAIGSPYEANDDENTGAGNTGAVYIYYGKSASNDFISTSPDQIILGEDIVSAVPDVQSMRTFGSALFSGIDVDANQVNDLLVGAYESKTAVLIRSLSVAYLNVSVTASTEIVSIATTGNAISMFSVMVCASYSGRGLEDRSLDTSLVVFEDRESSNVARLYFAEDNSTLNQITMNFAFPRTNEKNCVNIPVFVKPVSQLRSVQFNVLSPLQVSVRFPPIPRRAPSFVGGDPEDLIDYRTIPILIVEGIRTTSVQPSVNCSERDPLTMQEICHPDLTFSLVNVTYIDSQNNTIPENQAVADVVQSINIKLLYKNIGVDPAFGSVLTFSVPERLSHVRVESSDQISCTRNGVSLYNCPLPSFITPSREGTPLVLVWRLPNNIVGNEPDDFSNISIGLSSAIRNQDSDTDNSNNNLSPIRIEYSAISDLNITRILFTLRPATYQGVTFTQSSLAVDGIGQPVRLVVNAENEGPSNARDATLDIFIPTSDMEGSYYIYLFDVETDNDVRCDESFLNPDGLSPPTGVRKRRMARMPRQSSGVTPAPQTDNSDDQIRDCSNPETVCSVISCDIRNLPNQASTSITVFAYLDERFFQSQSGPFVFVARATIRNNEDFFEDPIENNQGISLPYRVSRIASEDESFPIWIPIVCGIVAIIFIILLFVLLYFVGFFRRKKLEDTKEAEGDFASPPEGSDTNGKPLEEKPALTEDPVQPDDIGDAEDLEDGDADKPKVEVDPEETSL